MIDVRPFFSEKRTLYLKYATNLSTKKIIYLVSYLAHRTEPNINTSYSSRILANREKLGSTYIGYGVAIPHGRLKGLQQPVISLIGLKKPILYSSKDADLSHLFFGLLIPEIKDGEAQSDTHVTTLAALAAQLKRSDYRNKLIKADSNQMLYEAAIDIIL
jgi:PTS system nitrogen regulatory IIA component